MVAGPERLVTIFFHFELEVGALELAESFAFGNGHHNGRHLAVKLELVAINSADAVDNERLPSRKMHHLLAIGLLVNSGDPPEDHAANGHFLNKVEGSSVAELIQSSSDRAFVTYLHKAAGLSNVCNVAEGKIAPREGDLGSILEYLVPHIAALLLFLVLGQELL